MCVNFLSDSYGLDACVRRVFCLCMILTQTQEPSCIKQKAEIYIYRQAAKYYVRREPIYYVSHMHARVTV